VASNSDSRDACGSIAGESYKLWLDHENRTDDITIIIVHIKGFSNVCLNLPLAARFATLFFLYRLNFLFSLC
jgi:hypothetical protein